MKKVFIIYFFMMCIILSAMPGYALILEYNYQMGDKDSLNTGLIYSVGDIVNQSDLPSPVLADVGGTDATRSWEWAYWSFAHEAPEGALLLANLEIAHTSFTYAELSVFIQDNNGAFHEFELSDSNYPYYNGKGIYTVDSFDLSSYLNSFDGDVDFYLGSTNSNIAQWAYDYVSMTVRYSVDDDAPTPIYNPLPIDPIVKPSPASVPEPTTIFLLVPGLIGLAGLKKRLK